MSTPSQPPPAAAGGSAKYIILAIVFIIGMIGMAYCMVNKPAEEAPAVVATPDAGVAARGNSLGDDLVIPDAPVDMGPPVDMGVRRRIVYVDGPGGGGGDWGECSGEIPRAQVAAVFNEGRAGVTACYERRLKSQNTLEGNVLVKLKIAANGSVSAQQVNGTLRDNEVFSCIRALTSRWRFPATSGGCAVVQAPFNFTRHN